MSQETQADSKASFTGVDRKGGLDSTGMSMIKADRLVLDPARFVSSVDQEHIDSSDPLSGEWGRMRQTIAVFPFPRGERGPLAEALLRDEVEYSAETIAARSGCRWIVDKRLEPLFEETPEPKESSPITIETGVPALNQVDPSESWPRAFLRRLIGQPPPVVPDHVKIAPGILKKSGGGIRIGSECVTSVFHEAGSTDRIDVRIIGERRTVKLRFDSRNDPRFLAFWPRWRAEPSSDPASSTPA